MSLSQITSSLDLPRLISALLITGGLGWAGHSLMETVDQSARTTAAIDLMRQELTYKVTTLQEEVVSLRNRLQQVYTINDSSKDFALRDERYTALLSRLKELEQRFGRTEELVMEILMDLRGGGGKGPTKR